MEQQLTHKQPDKLCNSQSQAQQPHQELQSTTRRSNSTTLPNKPKPNITSRNSIPNSYRNNNTRTLQEDTLLLLKLWVQPVPDGNNERPNIPRCNYRDSDNGNRRRMGNY